MGTKRGETGHSMPRGSKKRTQHLVCGISWRNRYCGLLGELVHEDKSRDGRIILKRIIENYWNNMS
jgi:hypothetical protein